MPQPASQPRWANVGGDIVEPASGKKDVGWIDAELPPHSYFNWYMNLVYQWTLYLAGLAGEAFTWTAAHIFQAGIVVTQSTSNGNGASVTGNGTGKGGVFVGGSSSGTGVHSTAGAGNGKGGEFFGTGTGAGLQATGGATGDGANFTGGATSGNGVTGTAVGAASGVSGSASNTNGSIGVSGGSGTAGTNQAGVKGTANHNGAAGVWGKGHNSSNAGAGVFGESSHADSAAIRGFALFGATATVAAIQGFGPTTGNGGGVEGFGTGTGSGVKGVTGGGATSGMKGVHGVNGGTNGHAGYFENTHASNAQPVVVISDAGASTGLSVASSTGCAISAGALGGTAHVINSQGTGSGASLHGRANGTGVGLNVFPQSAPSSPQNGDIWVDTGDNTLKVRINGVTKTVTVT